MWPPMFSLSEQERDTYCDEQFYRLMKVVMIADSESYNFLINPVKMLEWR